MEERLAMYQLKPVFEIINDITLPTNMYKMKNIHTTCFLNNTDENINGIEVVHKKQQILLQKIENIKQILAELKDELAVPKIDSVIRGTAKMCSKPNFSEFGITHDVVLNISITKIYPPYSLLVINKIWPNINLTYTCHLHSSAKCLPPAFIQFQDELIAKNPKCEPDLNVRIVWKSAEPDCEFVISPIKSVSLIGEVNFLRFLYTSIPRNSDVIEETLIDEKLDACYCLALCQSANDMKPHLETLANGLERNQWLCGDNLSIVDVAAWSVIKKMKKHNLGKPKLNEWYQNCNEVLSK